MNRALLRWTAAAVVAAGAAVAGWLALRPAEPPEFAQLAPLAGVGPAVSSASQTLDVEPVMIDDLTADAEVALGGYALALGAVDDGGGWTIDVGAAGLDESATDAVADRIAHGLLARGLPFERSGLRWDVLEGAGGLPEVRPDDDPAVVVAAIVETAGSVDGGLVDGGLVDGGRSDADNLAEISGLARSLGLDPVVDGQRLVLTRRADRMLVAGLAYVCDQRVPLRPGRSCEGADAPLVEVSVTDLSSWTVGITGSLIPGAPEDPPSSEGGIGWTNREAQRYVADAVTVGPAGITLSARPHPTPSIDELPYTSGLIVMDESVGLGVVEVDVIVPAGDGLWPAVWLLDAEACVMPGRCPSYATSAYHEIDILETDGSQPDAAVTSLHWWDTQLRSASHATSIAGLSEAPHTLRLERRPGLLRWLVDGEEVFVIAGPVDALAGPHRTAPMQLIVNLAVGGVFAGDRQIGRFGQWWGDARVPSSFPDVGWDEATLQLQAVRVSP